jgi:hypothetical protein
VVVLCGRLVAAAFGLNLDRSVPWTEETDGVRFLVLPHPSGAVAIKESGICGIVMYVVCYGVGC